MYVSGLRGYILKMQENVLISMTFSEILPNYIFGNGQRDGYEAGEVVDAR